MCTGIKIYTKDGATISARTMELHAFPTELVLFPRGQKTIANEPCGIKTEWVSIYGICAMTASASHRFCLEGLNERGLGMGLFNFIRYFENLENRAGENASSITQLELDAVYYVLSTCASVEEAVTMIKQINLSDASIASDYPSRLSHHFRIVDTTGRCVVVECVNGKKHIHENPAGMITNEPAFDWHMTNLSLYKRLSAVEEYNEYSHKDEFIQFATGAGYGLRGLPGDFSSSSRFIRAAIFSKNAKEADTSDDGINQAFHILNSFDITDGSMIRKAKDGTAISHVTLWTSAIDHSNKKFYLHTINNRSVRVIDISKIDFSGAKEIVIDIKEGDDFIDVTPG